MYFIANAPHRLVFNKESGFICADYCRTDLDEATYDSILCVCLIIAGNKTHGMVYLHGVDQYFKDICKELLSSFFKE